MTNTKLTPKFTFTQRAAEGGLDDSAILNSNNEAGPSPPNDSDVVVTGGGIHGLIYAIHLVKHQPGKLRVSLIEKNRKPGYKVGESTLPLFSMWLKMHGLTGEYLLRIFGVKDGFSFYFLDRENQGEYTELQSFGTPGPYLSGFQLERPMSELLLTLFAQRNGVNVYHGRSVDFKASKVQGGMKNSEIQLAPGRQGQPESSIGSSLLVDATGRFRQYASKNARLHRFEGWNYDAFWGYFAYPADESKVPLRNFVGCNTNHLCFPEGWFWVIRILSWEGSPTANLMDMLSYLLECSEKGIPGDQVPSTEELAKMFGLTYRWVTSIGVACRNDVVYPDNLADYGSTEAERKFNYFVRKYSVISEFMDHFELIENLYGPGTTWFVRKTLTYQSPVVSGPGWLAVGDACGFTNPLFSPGITANMSTSTYAAELTHKAFEAAESERTLDLAETSIRKTLTPYDEFAKALIPKLNMMNCFNYVCFRDPRLGPQVSSMWQNLASAIAGFGAVVGKFTLDSETFLPYALRWRWGSAIEEYNAVALRAIELIKPIPLEERVPDAIVREIINFSNKVKPLAIKILADRGANIRWGGFFSCYDHDLNYLEKETRGDVFTRLCCHCGSWLVLRPDWTLCYTCGVERTAKEAAIEWYPPAPVEQAA